MWTRKSAAVAGASALALLAGLFLPNVALASLGLAGATWLAGAYLQSRSLHVAAERRLGQDRLREEDALEVVLTLRNEGDGAGFLVASDELPTSFRLTSGSNVTFARLESGEERPVAYEVESPVKGHYHLGPVRLRLMDVFGLFHEDVALEVEDFVTVYPRAEDVGSVPGRARYPRIFLGSHRVRQPGQGMEFFGLREYVYGDALRQVNWKASAKTGRQDDLIVNQRERESMSDVTIILDRRAVSAAGEEPRWPLVQSARAAATLLELFRGQRDRVRLALYGPGVDVISPGSGESHRLRCLDTLAEVEPEGDTPLGELVDEVLPTLLPKSPVFLLSSLVDDPTLLDAVERLLALENSVVVIAPRPPTPADDGSEEARAVVEMEREARLGALRGYGAIVVEWEPDERLTMALSREVLPA